MTAHPPKYQPPDGYVIPDGYTYTNRGSCRSCGAPIAWCTTRAGKRAPLNPDGTSHYSTCPQADTWRKRT